jgi:hypothetical protein
MQKLSIMVSSKRRNLTTSSYLTLVLHACPSPYDFVTVASAPLAFTTPSPEFREGIATGRPRAFDVKATISLSISSRVSLAKSSTSEGLRFFVSIGFKTIRS